MDGHYNIGQLARAAGVPLSTLRYYERAGLLSPTGRARNNYRFYTQDALQIVRFIRAAQATGFTLDDVGTLLTLWNGHTALCQDVQPLVARRILPRDRQAHGSLVLISVFLLNGTSNQTALDLARRCKVYVYSC